MFGKKMTKGTLVVFLAALFVMALAYQASADSAFSVGGGTPFTYTGKIVAIDYAEKIVTVQAGPNDELTFNVDNSAPVTKCSMSESFGNLRMGEEVTVSYFEEGAGSYIASGIDLAITHC